jgi:flavin-dependent dehydrogenase
MTLYQWLGVGLSGLALALLVAAAVVMAARHRRLRARPRSGWLTDDMVRQIIEVGRLTDQQVPEESLDLEKIAREEERFWSESWDEPERYWD